MANDEYSNYIDKLLDQHYSESVAGIVEKPPSRLLRGEGTARDFFILKIDIVGSTMMLQGRQRSTYLRFAHVFLSTVDRITKDCGADPAQTEYAGDSVMAYFPSGKVDAADVIYAAQYCRAAVLGMHKLDRTFQVLAPKCKITLHHGTLILSNIGPRADSVITAIGHPLHVVSKIEKEIAPDVGRATVEFFKRTAALYQKYLAPVHEQSNATSPSQYNSLTPVQKIASALYPTNIKGYDLRWGLIKLNIDRGLF